MLPKKVKIVATLGPASHTEELVHQLAEAGVNVFRRNLSHATKEEIVEMVKWVRSAEKKLGKPIAILGDLAGPKIRIGDMEEGTIIEKGQEIKIVTEPVIGNKQRVTLNYPTIVPQLKKGAEVFIDDGKLKMEIIKESKTEAVARVIVGGLLKPRKGFNAQGISLSAKGLSAKDKEDMAFVLKQGVEALAVSFVQSAADIEVVRSLLPKNSPVKLIAKIETMKGMEDIEQIVDAADIIMIARGDLGLAVPMEEIPHMQKQIIDLCRRKAKPVITATQMLESMTTNPIPTRAEVTDVANAILDGTDCVMLSGETAAGDFPVEAVKMMARIIRRTTPHVAPEHYTSDPSIAHAISSSVGAVAHELKARVIFAFTEGGSTARHIARHRYPQVTFALSPNLITARQLNFSAGVYSFSIEPTKDFDHMIEQVKKLARKNNVLDLEKGEPVVIAAGLPFGKPGTTNLLYVERA